MGRGSSPSAWDFNKLPSRFTASDLSDCKFSVGGCLTSMCSPSYLLNKYVQWVLHPPISFSVQGIVYFKLFIPFKLKLSSTAFRAVLSACLVFACVICKRLYMLTRATNALMLLSLTTIRSNIICDLAT